jgi:alanyl-tRNA synthetase
MTSAEIRQAFLDFFRSKGHEIVPSAPIVIKDDPTLMFTNAGMNQFKDYFLGNKKPPYARVADTQKCLRVSGKHNDLEEVGVDTYHHTMFEMLGNWSFGDYFKKEAIAWSWELLTKVYKIPEDKLYVTVFGGDEKEKLPKDEEAIIEWKKWIDEDRILLFGKKDNFWEMGDTGPCGPCTEIHYDSRPGANNDGHSLVNNDDTGKVVEIWNNVFIEFNRLKNGSLEPLPAKHVDTGMGLERLVRVLQGEQSSYDTDIFTPLIGFLEREFQRNYSSAQEHDKIAMRVISDHIRAVSFAIADGQLPSNTGAGYVIRRILRRAIRYGYSFLKAWQPFMFEMVDTLDSIMGNVFPELRKQKEFIKKVIKEEEAGFFKTLSEGIWKLQYFFQYGYHDSFQISKAECFENHRKKIVPGKLAFILSDTDGFPLDLTKLISSENNFGVDEIGFEKEMQQQKNRSRAATTIDTEDWIVLKEGTNKFIGYDSLESKSQILKYRKVTAKGKEAYQIVLDITPFYAESGGQVGDTGTLIINNEELIVTDTKKDNDLIIHFVETIPSDLRGTVFAKVDHDKRKKTELNHTATHLLQAALREVLGKHVTQKGSLVNDKYLRFDFSHFAKLTEEESTRVQKLVNKKIRENIPVFVEYMSKEEALNRGAMALFGEKYGDLVRVVTIDPNYSMELCGGTHVRATGELGFFVFNSESAVSAGVRRIEALCGEAAEDSINAIFDQITALHKRFKNPKSIDQSIDNLQTENAELKKHAEVMEARQLVGIRNELLHKDEIINGVTFIGEIIEVSNPDALKKLCFELKNKLNDHLAVLCANIDGKAHVAVGISERVVVAKNLDAGKIIKEYVAPLIKGGGGGQKTLATAGGQDVSNLQKVIETVKKLL